MIELEGVLRYTGTHESYMRFVGRSPPRGGALRLKRCAGMNSDFGDF